VPAAPHGLLQAPALLITQPPRPAAAQPSRRLSADPVNLCGQRTKPTRRPASGPETLVDAYMIAAEVTKEPNYSGLAPVPRHRRHLSGPGATRETARAIDPPVPVVYAGSDPPLQRHRRPAELAFRATGRIARAERPPAERNPGPKESGRNNQVQRTGKMPPVDKDFFL
jgi:hypothetical protein